VKRLTESERALLLVLVIVAALAWLGYRYRIHIEAWWWHFRHGEAVAMADYVVPAPTNWYVEDADDTNAVLVLMDTDKRIGGAWREGKLPFTAVIDASERLQTWTTDKLDLWTSFQTSFLKKRGIEPNFQKFSLNGESLSCVGGQKFSQVVNGRQFLASDPNIWSCESSSRLSLHITATDGSMQQVWNIVSRIHKKS